MGRLMDKGIFKELKYIDLIYEKILWTRNIVRNLERRDAMLFDNSNKIQISLIHEPYKL
jgi:hypothetical protein